MNRIEQLEKEVLILEKERDEARQKVRDLEREVVSLKAKDNSSEKDRTV